MSPQTNLEPEILIDWVGDQILWHPMLARAVGAKKLDDMKSPSAEWLKLLREFSPIKHLSANDPPVLLSYPRMDALPATTPGSAIHHALFGVQFQKQAQAVGAACVLRIENSTAAATTPNPEDFLIEQLSR